MKSDPVVLASLPPGWSCECSWRLIYRHALPARRNRYRENYSDPLSVLRDLVMRPLVLFTHFASMLPALWIVAGGVVIGTASLTALKGHHVETPVSSQYESFKSSCVFEPQSVAREG